MTITALMHRKSASDVKTSSESEQIGLTNAARQVLIASDVTN